MLTKPVISKAADAHTAVHELVSQLGARPPRVLVFFAASTLDHAVLARGLKQAYPASDVLGCTTAGELCAGEMTTGAVVAMGLPDTLIARSACQLVRDPAERSSVERAFEQLEASLGTASERWDHARHVGLVLVDGLSGSEEALMDAVGDLTSVPFVGGSAGDDLRFERTEVSLNGEVASNAAVLAVLETRREFAVVKTQSFRALPKRLVATKVDEARRTVHEFDGRPAAEAYAEALGISAAELSGAFMAHPLGLMAGDEPYVRSPQRLDGTAVVFYCNVREGTELRVLEAGDIVADTRRALAEQAAAMQGFSAVIDFHCILRTLELRERRQTGDYGALFRDLPMIGFSTYGEEWVGHINQTSTILVFR